MSVLFFLLILASCGPRDAIAAYTAAPDDRWCLDAKLFTATYEPV